MYKRQVLFTYHVDVRLKYDSLAVFHTRSSGLSLIHISSKQDIANMVRTVFEMGGAAVSFGDGYPGWLVSMRMI